MLLKNMDGKMKFKQYLEEEYLGFTVDYNNKEKNVEVFKNPSKSELRECGEHIRFVIDFKNEKLYVADAHYCIHNDILRSIRKNLNQNFHTDVMDRKFWLDCFAGFASNEVGKLVYKNCAEGAWGYAIDEYVKKKPKFDDTWLKHWFTAPFLQTIVDKKDKLSEEYVFSTKSYYQDKTYEVFVNPSKKEIQDASNNKMIRFCIDLKKQKLYVWNTSLLHENVAQQAIKDGLMDFNAYEYQHAVRNPYGWGVANVVMGKLELYDGDPDDQSNIDFDVWPKKVDKHGKDLSWLKHWFTQDSYDELTEDE